MGEKIRKAGIDVLGDLYWGTHLCQFFKTKKDLIDVLVPYFKAGLENNEFCMWVTSEPLKEEEARDALKKAVKNLDDYIEKGQIEIIDAGRWYTRTGMFDAERVLEGWVRKERKALKRGYDGLRLSGNTFWLGSKDWKDFSDYEAVVNRIINQHRMIAICSYSLDKCGASEIIDVVSNHQFVLIRKKGKWVLIEASEYKLKKEVLSESNKQLRILQMVTEAVHSSLDLETVFKQITDGFVHSMGYTTAIIFIKGEDNCFETMAFSTKKPLLPLINRILGFPLKSLSFPADPGLNDAMNSAMKGRVVVVRSLAKIAYPAISKRKCSALQKLKETKNYIIAPLMVDDKLMGGVLISSPREVVSEDEVWLIKSFAHVASSAIKNANLHLETERARKALQESENRYRELWANAPVAYHVLDKKGTIIRVNKTEARMLGYRQEEMVGQPIFKFISPEQRQKARKRFEQKIAGRHIPRAENRTYLKKDGSRIHVAIDDVLEKDNDGKISGIRSTMVDITERHRAEERTRIMLDHVVIGISIITPEMEIAWLNKTLKKWFPRVDVRKKPLCYQAFYSPPKEKICDYCPTLKAFKTGKTHLAETGVCADGRIYKVIATPVKDEKGKAVYVVETIEDITARDKAEELLRESEEKYSNLFYHSNDAIFLHDLEGNIIDVNRKTLGMFGYTKSEILSLGVHKLHPAEALEKSRQAFDRISKKGFVKFEIDFKKKNGQVFPAEVSSSLFDIKGKKVIQGIVRDITERREAKRALEESEKKFRSFFNHASDAIFIHDLKGKMLEVNRTACERLGYSRKQLLQMTPMSIDTPEYALLVAGRIKEIERKGHIIFESAHVTKSGKVIPIELSSRIIEFKGEPAVLSIGRDITERKEAEEAVRESEERYRDLVEKAGIAILIDDRKGNFKYMNKRFAELFGYSLEEMKKQSIQSIVHPDDMRKVLEYHKKRLQGRKVPGRYEFKGVRKDGSIRYLEVDAVPLRDRENVIGTRYYIWDITEWKNAEEKIKVSLKEKEVLLQEIHHRVKNNLQIISSLLRLQSQYFNDRKILEMFSASQSRIRSMALIHEALYQSKDLARINFYEYIQRLTSHLYSIYIHEKRGIQLKTDVKNVYLDINRAIPCGLIINELVSNSLKHGFLGRKKGDILVKMEVDKKGRYTLIVRDTGIGFPEGMDIHKTKTLGMQLIMDLVSQINGTIEVNKKKGTEFRIRF